MPAARTFPGLRNSWRTPSCHSTSATGACALDALALCLLVAQPIPLGGVSKSFLFFLGGGRGGCLVLECWSWQSFARRAMPVSRFTLRNVGGRDAVRALAEMPPGRRHHAVFVGSRWLRRSQKLLSSCLQLATAPAFFQHSFVAVPLCLAHVANAEDMVRVGLSSSTKRVEDLVGSRVLSLYKQKMLR